MTPTRIEIPAFPGGKRIAVTTSWDDGRVYDRWVVELFNHLGLKGAFNPSALPVSLMVNGALCEAAPGLTCLDRL